MPRRALSGPEGEPRGSVCIAIDVTDRYEAEQERRRFSQRLLKAEEDERRRIARELHDGVSQVLASALYRLRAAAQSPPPAPAPPRALPLGGHLAHAYLQEGIKQVEEAIQDIRRQVRNLRPVALERFGLRGAIERMRQEFQANTGVEVNLCNSAQLDDLKDDVKLTLYRVLHSTSPSRRSAVSRSHAACSGPTPRSRCWSSACTTIAR